jgi:peptidase M28-like protein
MPALGHSLRRTVTATVLAMAFAMLVAGEARAQRYPLLDSVSVALMSGEISGDAAYDHVRTLSAYHRPQGSDTLMVVAQYVERMAKAFGLDGVRIITLPSLRSTWNPGFADLWIVGEGGVLPERIAGSLQHRLHLADRSRPADVTGELIDIGAGSAADIQGRDVAGKIVLTTGDLNRVMAEAVQRRGALGVIWYPDPYTPSRGYLSFGVDQPDMVPWLTLATRRVDGKDPTFAFILSLREGVALRNRLAAARTPLRARALVQTELGSRVHAEPWMPMVEALIPGSDPGARQDVVLSAHLQEGYQSANDDGSGIASVLEIGRALTRLIAQGKLPRPRRTIRLWWTTENDAERQYFAAHPDTLRRIWVDVNQDMVGADQSLDVMRTQDVTRLPAARFHLLNDVMESVVDYMVAANTSNITQYRNGIGLYPKPHLAHNGSLHRYNAQAVWYFGDSDHQSFLDAGVPAITFTNNPDRYIHSNLDDLFQIDRTQLGRNALSAALIAYTMASADMASLPRLAAEVVGRGEQRLGGSVRLALQMLAGAGAADRPAAYLAAADQVRYGADRERRAIRSLGQVAAPAAATVPVLLGELDRREAQAMRDLQAAWTAGGGGALPRPTLGPAETELAALRPAFVATPKEWLAAYDEIDWGSSLNGYVGREVLQSIDGTRTGLDIYRLVAAEVREGGTHYYGTASPEAVLALIRNVERLGLVRTK